MAKDCEVFVEMPPRERQRMWNQVILKPEWEDGGSDILLEAMSKTKVERAEVSVIEDRDMILNLLRDGYGIGATNRDVSQKLREWYHETLRDLASDAGPLYNDGSISTEEYALICKNLGDVFSNSICEHEKALSFHTKSLSLNEESLGPGHPMAATSHNWIGVLLGKMGEHEKSLVEYRKVFAIRELALGNDHPDTATSYNNIGSVFYVMGQHKEAMEAYRKALAIQEVAFDLLKILGRFGVLRRNESEYIQVGGSSW